MVELFEAHGLMGILLVVGLVIVGLVMQHFKREPP